MRAWHCSTILITRTENICQQTHLKDSELIFHVKHNYRKAQQNKKNIKKIQQNIIERTHKSKQKLRKQKSQM